MNRRERFSRTSMVRWRSGKSRGGEDRAPEGKDAYYPHAVSQSGRDGSTGVYSATPDIQTGNSTDTQKCSKKD